MGFKLRGKFLVGILAFLMAFGMCIPAALAVDPPLITAAEEGNLEEVKRLVESGANVNCKDKSGCTPLYYATCSCHPEVVEELITRGALIDVDMVIEAERRYDMCVTNECTLASDPFIGLSRLLGFEKESSLKQLPWSSEGCKKIIQLFAIHGVNFDKLYRLRLALKYHFSDAVEFLIDELADVDYFEGESESDLNRYMQEAVDDCCPKLIKLLVEKGADPNFIIYSGYGSETRILY